MDADRVQLPQLDENVVKDHLLAVGFFTYLYELTRGIVRYVDCDLTVVLMSGCEGLECQCNRYFFKFFEVERDFFEPYCIREID